MHQVECWHNGTLPGIPKLLEPEVTDQYLERGLTVALKCEVDRLLSIPRPQCELSKASLREYTRIEWMIRELMIDEQMSFVRPVKSLV